MTTLSLLFMAVSIALIAAESTVYFREQFEDGGEWNIYVLMLFVYYLCSLWLSSMW